MTTSNKIYLVKFNFGYYADKQPNYYWSYCDLVKHAKRYKTLKAAQERADRGIALNKQWQHNPQYSKRHPTDYKIEEYEVIESIQLVNSDVKV